MEVLEEVDHRQLVWTIPKALRSALRRDRKLLGELCRCAWQSLREYLKAVLGPGYTPGVIFAIQTKARKHESTKVRTKARIHGLRSYMTLPPTRVTKTGRSLISSSGTAR